MSVCSMLLVTVFGIRLVLFVGIMLIMTFLYVITMSVRSMLIVGIMFMMAATGYDGSRFFVIMSMLSFLCLARASARNASDQNSY